MDITHYTFAFFVFLLVCCVIWVYGRVMRGNKRGDKSVYEKEQRLFKMYQNIEDMLGGFEEYVEEAKKELDARMKQADMAPKSALSAREAKPSELEKKTGFAAEIKKSADAEVKKPAAAVIKAPPKGEKKLSPEVSKTPATRSAAAETKEPRKSITRDAEEPKQKIEELIPRYIEKGMTKEEIARALGVSSKEVALIMELKKLGAAGK